ncbi:hypothetical protein JOB18_005101 [Solea senegalensis]|uniref:Uncharacterized protein n=1 Tax=Solea senegalensis TaxID=28829 RepID=A0AAV6PFA9_SOLSE|nr:hypothetical protein JOB18_005101 [Solea senegalensis]
MPPKKTNRGQIHQSSLTNFATSPAKDKLTASNMNPTADTGATTSVDCQKQSEADITTTEESDYWRQVLAVHAETPLSSTSKTCGPQDSHGRLFEPLTSPELNSFYKSHTNRGSVRGRSSRQQGHTVSNIRVEPGRRFFTNINTFTSHRHILHTNRNIKTDERVNETTEKNRKKKKGKTLLS